ncbi:MAG: DUF4012 domain-containing protein [Candidatus Gracilibacteria bacterium]|nr:DUF4012 domain-containing protein [Candidatus Gracilibacteria bacterium]
MKLRYWDLPQQKAENESIYMRRVEKRLMPQSYRTGLAFFITVLMVSLLSLTGIDAHTLAQQKRDELSSEVYQTLTLLDEQITEKQEEPMRVLDWALASAFDTKGDNSLTRDASREDSYHHLAIPGSHKDLVELKLHVSDGYRQLRSLMENWANPELNALERLDQAQKMSAQISDEWIQALESPLLSENTEMNVAGRQQSYARMQRLREFKNQFDHLITYLPKLKQLLGAQEPQRLLIMIQDGAEQMASGGALSTGVELVVNNGRVITKRVLSLRDIDRLLRVDLPPPHKLDRVKSRWGMETANVFLNGAKSGEKAHWFWQQGARSSLDAIFFVDISAIERLYPSSLRTTLSQHGFDTQSEDLKLLWSQLRRSDDPARIVQLTTALSAALFKASLDPQWMLSRLEVIGELVDEKLLLSYSPNHDLQAWFDEVRMSGSLPPLGTGQDALIIGDMNIGNNATDRWIDESRKLHTAIEDNGTIKHWLQITKKHQGNLPRESELADALGDKPSRSEISELARQDNSSYTRILVPAGSTLISSQGIDLVDISQGEAGDYSVWGFESTVSAGQTSQIELVYHLPWTFHVEAVDNYKLQVIKQSGSKPVSFDHEFKTPLGAQVFQRIPEELPAILNKDYSIAIVAGKTL